MIDLSVILLHENMRDKQGKLVTTSLTMIDVHDIARSAKTYGLSHAFIAHPSPTLRRLAYTLKEHWQDGFGAVYNPTRKDALLGVEIVSSLDEAAAKIDMRTGRLPRLIATSARVNPRERLKFGLMRELIHAGTEPFLLMLGTGWGMCDELLARADYFLDPISGPTEYNHLSVRSACAVMLDRLMAP